MMLINSLSDKDHMLNVLVIDDSPDQIILLETIIEDISYPDCKIFKADNGDDGIKIVNSDAIDIVLTDFMMPNKNGLEVLKEIKQLTPQIDVVIMTAHADIENAVSIMRHGAYEYLQKPIKRDSIETLLKSVYEKKLARKEQKSIIETLEASVNYKAIISSSTEMEDVLSLAARSASSEASLLIRGESGTGKELIAQAIHHFSDRKEKPFVTVNIAALPESLIESELFGHKKGSFTGANQDRVGRFEEAEDGILFIDELGDIPLSVQVKILRAIQFGIIERVGDNDPIKINTRIIAATNQDLEALIKEKKFRLDLLYRLNVITIWIPPLRNRKDDISILSDHFISNFSDKNHKKILGITDEAMSKLMRYSFPGNVRELENIIERAIVLSRGEYITAQDIYLDSMDKENECRGLLNPRDLKDGYSEKLNAFERIMLTEALEDNNKNKSAAARTLGISERRLRSRMDILEMESDSTK